MEKFTYTSGPTISCGKYTHGLMDQLFLDELHVKIKELWAMQGKGTIGSSQKAKSTEDHCKQDLYLTASHSIASMTYSR